LTAVDTVAAGSERLARAVFALLVVACFAAFFITQRLKHTPTAVQAFKLTPFFSPTPAGHIKAERISFKIARSDDVTVTIVNSAGVDIATLVRGLPVAAYKPVSLRWNGRRGTARRYSVVGAAGGHASIAPANRGRLAPAGDYRVRVTLRRRHRSILSPRSFTLVRR
jgi:hypothetical protein